ncbi:MAG: Iron(3+)-hydroxamate import ATP-binding protein FhuC [Candidatus Erwinia impunctatus]|nr:Iron(3+)-hydroxamate import ATP-binding protein FhuC [Culicoides impunctatus]
MSVDPTNESYARFSPEKVSYRIGDRTLLDSLTLTFPVAQFCGLIGHNGSGKSTLLKLQLCGRAVQRHFAYYHSGMVTDRIITDPGRCSAGVCRSQ